MAAMEMRIPNRLAEIGRLGDWAEGFCARHALPPAVVNGLRVSLDEVLSNIISYAYDDDATHEIAVRLALADGMLSVEIEDDGVPFDWTQARGADRTAPLMDREVGGLGIEFLKALNDSVVYRRGDGRNFLVLTKKVTETS